MKNDSINRRPEILRRARGEELAEACYKKAIERGQTARAFRFAEWWTAISNRANEIVMSSVTTFRN